MAIATEPVRQAFGSPGGKTYLAPKIADMMPPHDVYVEAFAGGAAVYFKKEPAKQEVLNDKDSDIASAFRFLKQMTPEQYERLKKMNWVISPGTFKRLKASNPTDPVERFHRFYYLKRGSFALRGDGVNTGNIGAKINIDRLPGVGDRLNRTTLFNTDAKNLIPRYDSKGTLFYLDPPYPGRAAVNSKGSGTFSQEQLQDLVSRLQGIRGKFILSLNKECAKDMPKNWYVSRVWVKRRLVTADGEPVKSEYEIIATNFPPKMKGRAVPRLSR